MITSTDKPKMKVSTDHSVESEEKSGYRHTKLGWIPKEWRIEKIGQIASVTGGYAFKSNKMLSSNSEYQILKMSNVYQGVLDLSRNSSFWKQPTEREKEYLLVKEDIVLTLTGTVGKRDFGFVTQINNEKNLLLNQRLCKISAKEGAYNPFLYYLLKSERFLFYFFLSSRGGTGNQANVGTNDVKSIDVPLPPLPEQQKIAQILSTWDKAVAKMEQLILKKQDRKKGLMQQLLTGKKRFKEFVKSDKMKETKLGWIPEDWEEVTFADIADNEVKWSITGGPFGSDLKSEDFTETGVRILQLQNLGDGRFIDNYKIYTSEKKADQLKACNIFPGELILSKMGDPVARACMIPNSETRYLMASDGIRLVPDKKLFDVHFVLEYINYSIFRRLAIRHSTGSTRQRIGLTDLKKLPFVKPPLDEQKSISGALSASKAEIASIQSQLDQLKEQKKGLMQKLLTGEVRVKID